MAKKIEAHEVDYLRKLTPLEGAKIYAKLRAQVDEAGILKRDYAHYGLLSIVDLAGIVGCVYMFSITNQLLWLVIWAIGVGFFTVRIGGLLHDAGHRAIFKSPLLNDIYGYFYSALIAFPFQKWKVKHNAHHAHTNEIDEDPDLDIPFHFLEEKPPKITPLNWWIYKYQVWLYWPLGSLVSFSLRYNAYRSFGESLDWKKGGLMALHTVSIFAWYVLPFILFPWWKAAIFFGVTNVAAGFYLLNIFAPNHKGMPQIDNGVKFSFLEQQVITSRNIFGHWLTDYLYLGLNYQMEHHLFVDCPRRNLKLISPYVRKICKDNKLPYVQTTIIESNRAIFSELRKAASYAN